MHSRGTAGRSPLATIASVAALGVCAATLAWELRAVGQILPRRPHRHITPIVELVLPRAHPPRERKRGERPGGRDPVTAAFERGVATYNVDDADAAADAFEEAVRLAPDEPEARINLGLVYLRLQRPEDAMRELSMGASLAKRREGR